MLNLAHRRRPAAETARDGGKDPDGAAEIGPGR
jgi:hypothetical protein